MITFSKFSNYHLLFQKFLKYSQKLFTVFSCSNPKSFFVNCLQCFVGYFYFQNTV